MGNKRGHGIPLKVEEEAPVKLKVRDAPKIGLSVEEAFFIGSGTNDYNELENHPTINDVEVVGDKTGPDYHLQNKLTAGDYITLDGTTISADLEYATYSEVLAYLSQ